MGVSVLLIEGKVHSGGSNMLGIERYRHRFLIERHTALGKVHRAVDQNTVCPDAFGVQHGIAVDPAQLIDQTSITESFLAAPLEDFVMVIWAGVDV